MISAGGGRKAPAVLLLKKVNFMLSSTVIRYLLIIHRLSPDNRPIPSVAISRQLNVTRSSVAKTLSQLTEEGLVEKAHYGKARLSPLGRRLAVQYQEEQQSFYRLFLQLGLSPQSAEQEAMTVVSSLSPEGKQALTALLPYPMPLASGN